MEANCEKCGIEFDNYSRWCVKRFCSRKCANSHTHTIEVRQQIKETLTKFYEGLTVEERKVKGRVYWPEEAREKAKATIKAKHALIPIDKLCHDARRRRVIAEQNDKCLICELSHWQDAKLSLEMDHIDGNRKNNSRDNLRALCPNCHSLTHSWRGRGRTGKSSQPIPTEGYNSISDFLRSKGRNPTGGHYRRFKKEQEVIGE